MKYLLVAEIANHFRCIDMIIDDAKAALTEKFIKELHLVLKNCTILAIQTNRRKLPSIRILRIRDRRLPLKKSQKNQRKPKHHRHQKSLADLATVPKRAITPTFTDCLHFF